MRLPPLCVAFAALLFPSCQLTQGGSAPVGDQRPVVGVHSLKLKEGVSPEQFEEFAAGPFADYWADPIGGMQAGVAKCDRGQNLGEYELAWFFDSLERRNAYFPTPETTSALWEDEYEAQVSPILSQLFAYCTREGFTDYVFLQRTPVPAGEEDSIGLFGIHDLELREGVEPAEFETFVAGPFAEAWNEEIAGLGRAVLKGDRGDNAGGYRIVYRFRPYTLRDLYIPEPSRLSDEFRNEVMPLLPGEVDGQFNSLAASAGFSDWVLVHR